MVLATTVKASIVGCRLEADMAFRYVWTRVFPAILVDVAGTSVELDWH